MRGSGSMIIGTVGALNATVMETSTKVTSGIINHMVKVSTLGSMGKCMKANGKMASRKVKAFGKESSVTRISASGLKVKLMGTVFTSGRTGIDTKVSGNSASNTAKAQIFSQMQMFTPDSTQTENHTALDNTNGKTLLST
jgi:hypothetical protein